MDSNDDSLVVKDSRSLVTSYSIFMVVTAAVGGYLTWRIGGMSRAAAGFNLVLTVGVVLLTFRSLMKLSDVTFSAETVTLKGIVFPWRRAYRQDELVAIKRVSRRAQNKQISALELHFADGAMRELNELRNPNYHDALLYLEERLADDFARVESEADADAAAED